MVEKTQPDAEMKKLSIGITLLLFACIFLHAQQTPQQGSGPEVKTVSGIVRGDRRRCLHLQRHSLCSTTSRCNRWRPPQPVTRMEGSA